MTDIEHQVGRALRRQAGEVAVSADLPARIVERVARRARRRRRLLLVGSPTALAVAVAAVALTVGAGSQHQTPTAVPTTAHRAIGLRGPSHRSTVDHGPATSCAVLGPSELRRTARLVFVATMLTGPTASVDGHAVLLSPGRAHVDRYIKGRGPTTVQVVTGVTRTATGVSIDERGIQPQRGQRWEIYSSSRASPLATDVCDGSRLIGSP